MAFEATVPCFPVEKVAVTGMPVRNELLSLPKKAVARKKLGLDTKLFTVLVIGGSQGARTLNKAVSGAISDLQGYPVQILHQTGTRNFEESAAGTTSPTNYHVRAYLDDMVAAYASADLVMCRCGSSTIAELTAVGLPAILVPYPYSHLDHQRLNAEILEKKGAGILVADSELTPAAYSRQALFRN